MRFIPTRFHAPLDYIVGAVLIAAPWIFQFSDSGAATAVSIVLGIGLIAYSLFTNYELGVWKVAPMAVHNVIDVVAGALLALSPWLFGLRRRGHELLGPVRRDRGRGDLPRPHHETGRRLSLRHHPTGDRGRLTLVPLRGAPWGAASVRAA
jgi:SPW repeat-containing protein